MTVKNRSRRLTRRRSLRFSPYAWAKLLYMRDRGDSEIGGFGLSDVNDPLMIVDFMTVKQRCSIVSVAFEDASVADLFDDLIDHGWQPNQFSRVWLHSHPGNCPLPSHTDEATFRRVFGRTEWSVMAIIARGGATYARLSFHVGPGGALTIPMRVDFGLPFESADWKAWDLEYQRNVAVEPLCVAQTTQIPAGSLFGNRERILFHGDDVYDGAEGAEPF